MGREIDIRNFGKGRITAARKRSLRSRAGAISKRLPRQHKLRIESFDAFTGNASMVVSESSPKAKGNYAQRALHHLHETKAIRGFEKGQVPEYIADPHTQETSSGAVAIHFKQKHKGIDVFQADQTVHFHPAGALHQTLGTSVAIKQDMEVEPQLSVQQAVLKAAQHVASPGDDERLAADQAGEQLPLNEVDLTGYIPEIIASLADQPGRTTFLSGGPFGDKVRANLIWFPTGAGLRLGWQTVLTMPNLEGQYRVIVDAMSGQVLYCRQLMRFIFGRGQVFPLSGDSARQAVAFPLPLSAYPVKPIPPGLPPNFPDPWVASRSTLGNCALVDLGGNNQPFEGVIQNDIVVFDPPPNSVEQLLLNAFYFTCFMHDYFYLLGFREANGNFQFDNFGRGGTANDLAYTRVFLSQIINFASTLTPVDGTSPLISLGVIQATGRHTALDATMVFHEYTHGVTDRLVGGPLNTSALEQPQSAGMSEGWSDYIACTVTGADAIGAWVFNKPGGMRSLRYTSDFPAATANFGQLGSLGFTDSHSIGMVWCATLLEINRNIGADMGARLVVDALKLSPANPSFLIMRNCILTAINNLSSQGQLTSAEFAAIWRGVWSAFAKFGMGPAASSNGASLFDILPDFNMPPGV